MIGVIRLHEAQLCVESFLLKWWPDFSFWPAVALSLAFSSTPLMSQQTTAVAGATGQARGFGLRYQ